MFDIGHPPSAMQRIFLGKSQDFLMLLSIQIISDRWNFDFRYYKSG